MKKNGILKIQKFNISFKMAFIVFTAIFVQDQDLLIQELHSVRYFDVFEFNAPEKVWACFMCNHPDKVSNLLQDGFPVIAVGPSYKKSLRFRNNIGPIFFTLLNS